MTQSATCAGCGRPIDPSTASYSEQGEMICPSCNVKEELGASDRSVADGLFGSAAAAPLLVLLSLFFNPFWSLTIASIGAGIGSITYLEKNPEYKPLLGGRLVWVYILGIGGAAISILLAALILMSILKH